MKFFSSQGYRTLGRKGLPSDPEVRSSGCSGINILLTKLISFILNIEKDYFIVFFFL
jgi:hypothetical protein